MSSPRLLPTMVCVLLCASATAAQTPPSHDRTEPTAVTLTTDSSRVRFTSPGPALDWRLEIVNVHNDTIFDTGVVNGTDLEWPLVDAQGQAIESGVYSYLLTIQSRGSEARVQRGQLQIERARSVYQIATLSSDSAGGVMLTTMDAAPQPAKALPLDSSSELFRRSLGAVTFVQPLISGSGTTSSITKWLDGPSGVVGDTNVTEVNGSVVVGNGTFRGNVHIFGPADKDVFAGMGPNLITGPGFNYGYAGESFGRSAGFFNVRPDGSATPPNPSLRFMTANVERMIITNTGSVGIGTSAPSSSVKLVVVGGTSGIFAYGPTGTGVYGEGNANGVAGRSVGGGASYGVYGEASSGIGVRGHSNNMAGVLGTSFLEGGGGVAGNGVEGFSYTGLGVQGISTSNIGVEGTSTSSHGVRGISNGSGNGVFGSSNSGNGVYGISGTGNAGYFAGNVTVLGNLTVSGTCFCTLSDIRLKQDIAPLTYGLRQVLQLRPVSWHWKNRPTSSLDLGLIAQDVEPLLPELVQRAADDPNEPLRLNYVGLLPVLIKAIQEQQAALEEKDAEIRRLHARDREQETRLTILEARLQQLLKDSPTSEHLNKRPNK